MKLDVDQLVRRVAEKHKVIIGTDDPVLAIVALNEVIMVHRQPAPH